MMRRILLIILLPFLVGFPSLAHAEVNEVRISYQFGLQYAPLLIMKQQKLFEKELSRAGIDSTVEWVQLGSGSATNEALISGSVDFASAGVAPLVLLWDKTYGRNQVKGVAALNASPMSLITANPNIKTIRDFKPEDRIALPGAKVSAQAIVLEIAAEKAFGEGHAAQLDEQTVTMSHPDAMASILSEKPVIAAHFTIPPYSYDELKHPGFHEVLNSYQVFGGQTTLDAVFTTTSFREKNPKTYAAFLAALEQAIAYLNAHKQEAARVFLTDTGLSYPENTITDMLNSKDISFGTAPQNVIKFAKFMHKTGVIKHTPASWEDFFFPEIHGKKGS